LAWLEPAKCKSAGTCNRQNDGEFVVAPSSKPDELQHAVVANAVASHAATVWLNGAAYIATPHVRPEFFATIKPGLLPNAPISASEPLALAARSGAGCTP